MVTIPLYRWIWTVNSKCSSQMACRKDQGLSTHRVKMFLHIFLHLKVSKGKVGEMQAKRLPTSPPPSTAQGARSCCSHDKWTLSVQLDLEMTKPRFSWVNSQMGACDSDFKVSLMFLVVFCL